MFDIAKMKKKEEELIKAAALEIKELEDERIYELYSGNVRMPFVRVWRDSKVEEMSDDEYNTWCEQGMPLTQEMKDDCVYPDHILDKDKLYTLYAQELYQCARCETYTDDPAHWCGSVALVLLKDIPITWWYHCRPKEYWPHMTGLKDGEL